MVQAQAQVLTPEAVMPEGVQLPLEVPYRNCTTTPPSSLARATYSALLEVLAERTGHLPDEATCQALWELVQVLSGMAEGTASPMFTLSSLDPGIGKTTTLIVLRFVEGMGLDLLALHPMPSETLWETRRRVISLLAPISPARP